MRENGRGLAPPGKPTLLGHVRGRPGNRLRMRAQMPQALLSSGFTQPLRACGPAIIVASGHLAPRLTEPAEFLLTATTLVTSFSLYTETMYVKIVKSGQALPALRRVAEDPADSAR